MRRRRSPLFATLLLASCAQPDAPAPHPLSEDTAVRAPPGAIFREDSLVTPRSDVPAITNEGIGAARAGMTVGDVRAALQEGTTLGKLNPFLMVDWSGIPVIAGGDTLYHLGVPNTDRLHDADSLEFVITTNPDVRTAEGVGPGMTLAQAVASYGPATLRYSVNDEMREYAKFANHPGDRILFRVRPPTEGALAGVYATNDEVNETTEYAPGTVISMVMVTLFRMAP